MFAFESVDTKKPPECTLKGTGKAFASTGVGVHTYTINTSTPSFISI